MEDYSKIGSVDDIRCSLRLLNPQTRCQCVGFIENIDKSLENEQNNRNRVSVINLLNSKKRLFKKLVQLLPNQTGYEKV